jgi:hypothetical protein
MHSGAVFVFQGMVKFHRFGGIDQRVFGYFRKIGVTISNGSQEAIVELFGAPHFSELSTFAWKSFVDFGNNGIWIKNYEIIECDSFKAWHGLILRIALTTA